MTEALFFPGLIPTPYSRIRPFVENSEHAIRRFATADDVLGYHLADAYRTADIYDWEVFEAGFMAVSLALADWASEERGVHAGVCGGQSFGAFMAAVWAGALSYPEALQLVRRSVPVEDGYFASLDEPVGCHFFHKLPYDTVTKLVEEVHARGEWAEICVVLDEEVHAVSASQRTLTEFTRRVKEEGGIAFYTMNRAEHCTAVAGLRTRLHDEVYGAFPWKQARIPVVSDVDGRLLTEGEDIKQDLLDGWTTPVHWETILRGLHTAGAARVWIPGPRNMFARITNKSFPTELITPKMALAPGGAG
ncbi:ACP S-malonyltransferase [Streptomyces iconiensis]|uniref:[acyl-carrier-protein] S-malonyltransferase n=1 Tax=Streptomyces iconiensis TaxID=1384038 RepID=A0ABT7A5B6_9ACTN|nr:ACP S-malonyltransferase [Streptomyces iconiensis]MDJ1136549.1 ACP S-malonyltransferase [Streptomyces iconiensis]